MTTLDRKRITRHLRRCPICTEQSHRVAVPAALLGAGIALTSALGERVLAAAHRVQPAAYVTPNSQQAASTATTGDSANWPDGWPLADRRLLSTRRPTSGASVGAAAALAVAALLLLGAGVGGGYLTWHHGDAVATDADAIAPLQLTLSLATPPVSRTAPGMATATQTQTQTARP